ncbi:AAA family ATPase [Vibrio parahaemolyticus]|nr:AAA family ATPase [Vibrio parahaemolyticus]
MIIELQNLIEQNAVTAIIGAPYTGKSWLLSHYSDKSVMIDNRNSAMESGNGDITLDQFLGAINSEQTYVCLDESQLYKHHHIIELAKLILPQNKKLLIVSQYEENLPLRELIQVCSEHNDAPITLLRLDSWNSESTSPRSYDSRSLSLTS